MHRSGPGDTSPTAELTGPAGGFLVIFVQMLPLNRCLLYLTLFSPSLFLSICPNCAYSYAQV